MALGTRVRLTDIPIRSLAVSLSPPTGLSPGAEGQLVVVATAADGRQLVTVGTEGGKVLFDSFTIEASLVSVNARGEARLPHVRVRVVGQPAVVGDLDIPVRHDVRFTTRFIGEIGASGHDGRDGMRGSDGASGSSNPDNLSPGGNGADGTAGSDGERGGDGGPGPTVRVWIGLAPASPPRLRVHVVGDGQERFFLIDPQGGLSPGGVECGIGRRGGPGGSGGPGSPSGMSGSSGMDGSRGGAGSDGPPGKIVVRLDPLARPYLDRFLFSGHGGGRAPAPEIHVEPVGTLW